MMFTTGISTRGSSSAGMFIRARHPRIRMAAIAIRRTMGRWMERRVSPILQVSLCSSGAREHFVARADAGGAGEDDRLAGADVAAHHRPALVLPGDVYRNVHHA